MRILLMLLVCFFALHINAQQHTYSYDASGNRIKREYTILQGPGGLGEGRVKDSLSTAVPNSFSIKAYPNPIQDQVTIEVYSRDKLHGNERLLLYSELGQLIQEYRLDQKIKTINTQKLANGKYILRLFREEESHEFILIKN